jgi:hypothetical protein
LRFFSLLGLGNYWQKEKFPLSSASSGLLEEVDTGGWCANH